MTHKFFIFVLCLGLQQVQSHYLVLDDQNLGQMQGHIEANASFPITITGLKAQETVITLSGDVKAQLRKSLNIPNGFTIDSINNKPIQFRFNPCHSQKENEQNCQCLYLMVLNPTPFPQGFSIQVQGTSTADDGTSAQETNGVPTNELSGSDAYRQELIEKFQTIHDKIVSANQGLQAEKAFNQLGPLAEAFASLTLQSSQNFEDDPALSPIVESVDSLLDDVFNLWDNQKEQMPQQSPSKQNTALQRAKLKAYRQEYRRLDRARRKDSPPEDIKLKLTLIQVHIDALESDILDAELKKEMTALRDRILLAIEALKTKKSDSSYVTRTLTPGGMVSGTNIFAHTGPGKK